VRALLWAAALSVILPAWVHAKESSTLDVPIPNGRISLSMDACSEAPIVKILHDHKQDPSEWYSAKVYYKEDGYRQNDEVEKVDIVCWRVDLSRPGWAAILNKDSQLYRFKVFEPDGTRL
jgi:hypothetical protein